MRYRVLKFFTTCMNLGFIWLVIHLFTGGLDLPFTSGCLIISGFWLGYTYCRLGRLFQTYVSALSRAQILLPVATGVVLALLGLASASAAVLALVSVMELFGWVLVCLLYRHCAAEYRRVGHGPLPKDAWVDPDPSALRPGDLLLTSGRMAGVAHDAVGHGELVLRDPDGNLVCFSSYMGYGIVINPLLRVTKGNSKSGFYIAMRPVPAFTQEENDRAYQIALQMQAQNIAWREKVNARRRWLVDHLPLPGAWKERLFKMVRADGYDWRGLILGLRHKYAWTCIEACLDCFIGVGRKMRKYGTGLFGLGTGLLDPIVPVRFVYDPNLHLLDLNDKAAAEAKAPASC